LLNQGTDRQITLVCAPASFGKTTLEGELSDQAVLAGVLNTLYELYMVILSVVC
jgi:hypothetical protein